MKTLLLFLALAFAPAAVHAAEPNAVPTVMLESTDPIEIGDTSPQQALVPKEVQAPERGTTVALPAGMHMTSTDIAAILRRHEVMAYGRPSMTLERHAAALERELADDHVATDASMSDDTHADLSPAGTVSSIAAAVGDSTTVTDLEPSGLGLRPAPTRAPPCDGFAGTGSLLGLGIASSVGPVVSRPGRDERRRVGRLAGPLAELDPAAPLLAHVVEGAIATSEGVLPNRRVMIIAPRGCNPARPRALCPRCR